MELAGRGGGIGGEAELAVAGDVEGDLEGFWGGLVRWMVGAREWRVSDEGE